MPTPAFARGLVYPPYDRMLYLAGRRGATRRVWLRQSDHVLLSRQSDAQLRDWARAESADLAAYVDELLRRPAPERFAGLPLRSPLLMGIVNVTPNSFSDGGLYAETAAAIAHGRALAAAGAAIIDVGGESTRPGAEPVSPELEIARTEPVVRALAADGLCVSIDTRHAAVMRAAVAAGAAIINDVTALEGDPQSLQVAADSQAAIILMHMQGEPRTMQRNPVYRCAPLDVYDYLGDRIAACRAAGIAPARLCVDPGIGFGKSTQHNCQLLAHLDLFHMLGVPLLLGVSRKSFIAALSKNEPANQRLAGSLAAALVGLRQGVQILRVHDIAETAQAVAVWRAVEECGDDQQG